MHVPAGAVDARNLKLVIQYDGGRYAGWQRQPDYGPTVQGVLEEATEKIVRHPVQVQGAGRTDRGVHARGQAANFATSREIPSRNLLLAINTHLPSDIAVRELKDAPESFNARFDAVGKHYRYTIFRGAIRDAFVGRWSARYSGPLKVEAMREAGARLEGCFDFASFATRSNSPPSTTERTVYRVNVRERGPFLSIDVVGRSFLYNMVRSMAGTLLEVGRGKRAAKEIASVLEAKDRGAAGPTAEAQGLCLIEVFYDENSLRRSLDEIDDPEAFDCFPFAIPAPSGMDLPDREGQLPDREGIP